MRRARPLHPDHLPARRLAPLLTALGGALLVGCGAPDAARGTPRVVSQSVALGAERARATSTGAAARRAQRIGSTGNDSVAAGALMPDGAIAIAGQFEGEVTIGDHRLVSEGASDAFVAVLSPDGETRWAAGLGGPGFDAAAAIAVDALGDVTVVVEETVPPGAAAAPAVSIAVASFGPDGERRWQGRFGWAGWATVCGAAAGPDGEVIIAGTRGAGRPIVQPGDDAAGADVWLVKLDARGREAWHLTLGGEGWDQASGVVADDSGITVAGSFTGVFPFGRARRMARGASDGFIVRISSDGEPRWLRASGLPGDDRVTAIARLPAGGFAVATTGRSALGLTAWSRDGEVVWQSSREVSDGRARIGGLAARSDDALLITYDEGAAETVVVAEVTGTGVWRERVRLSAAFVAAGVIAGPDATGVALAGAFVDRLAIGEAALDGVGGIDGFVLALTH